MATFSRNFSGSDDARKQLVIRGPLLPAVVGFAQIPPAGVYREISGEALIDTGAVVCAVDLEFLRELGIAPAGMETIATPTGQAILQTYPARLSFPGTGLSDVVFSDFVGADLSHLGACALLGRSVLSSYVLNYDGPAGPFTITG